MESRPYVALYMLLNVQANNRLCFIVKGEKGDTGQVGVIGWPGLIVSQFFLFFTHIFINPFLCHSRAYLHIRTEMDY